MSQASKAGTVGEGPNKEDEEDEEGYHGIYEYWYWTFCPLGKSCSEQAWKRAKCWGRSKEEARQSLLKHLMKSALHQVELEEAKQLMKQNDSFLVKGEYDCDAMGQEKPTKKKKTWTEEPASQSSQQLDQLQNADVLAQALQRFAEQHNQSPSASPSAATKTSATSAQLVPTSQPLGHINLRPQQLQLMMDSVNRALMTARQSQRLAAGAAHAFREAAHVLQEQLLLLQSLWRAHQQ